ncbi:hypothetical protein [Streptomyces albidoflavus]|uniref:hypothetical protein n=1 Tax=Streptomyces albidoflavus TaxID=1886 RepID=UPI0033290DCB
MALKPEVSLTVALATGTLVYAIYQNATPTLADVRSVDQFNTDIESAERQASWTAAAAVAGISLLSRDPGPFILGGGMIIVMAWAHRHANMVNPLTGRAIGDGVNMSDLIPPTTQEEAPASYGYADAAVV